MRVDWAHVEPAVFFTSAAVVLIVLAFGVLDPQDAKWLFLGLQDWIVGTWSWLFVGATSLFLLFAVVALFAAVMIVCPCLLTGIKIVSTGTATRAKPTRSPSATMGCAA